MKLNWHTRLLGDKVLLVPYRRAHVPKYHSWMQDETLLTLTGSEPLSLEEEFNMQQTWRDGEDKCTFIVLLKTLFKGGEIEAMVGDTNIFISSDDEEKVGEVEVMIAEVTARGQRMGWEAVCTMMRFGVEKLGIKRFVARIKSDNSPSIRMFGKLGFAEFERSEVFKEVSFEARADEGFVRRLRGETGAYVEEEYVHEK